MRCYNLRYSTFKGELPAPLSLQLVDGTHSFVINIARGSHTESGLDADLFLHNPLVTDYFGHYYETYWNTCLPIKEGMKIFEPNLRADSAQP